MKYSWVYHKSQLVAIDFDTINQNSQIYKLDLFNSNLFDDFFYS